MRKLIPIDQLSPEYCDSLRETVETGLKKLAISEKGGSIEEWVCRDILPWSDLACVSAGQTDADHDYWGTAALVAITPLVYINHHLDADQFVAIYGVALRDTDPCIIKVLLQTGAAASTLAAWSIEEMLSSRIPIALTPEAVYYRGDKIVYVTVVPDHVGKAVGADAVADHLVLIGLMCTRAGETISK